MAATLFSVTAPSLVQKIVNWLRAGYPGGVDMEIATVAGKGVETLNSEIYAYSKQSLEDSITATKAVMGSKSLHEAFEYQSDYAKSAFESYIGELTKFGELFAATSKESFASLMPS